MKEESIVSILVALMAVSFGAYALSIGYDNVLIGSVLAFLGTVVGYVFGKGQKKENN